MSLRKAQQPTVHVCTYSMTAENLGHYNLQYQFDPQKSPIYALQYALLPKCLTTCTHHLIYRPLKSHLPSVPGVQPSVPAKHIDTVDHPHLKPKQSPCRGPPLLYPGSRITYRSLLSQSHPRIPTLLFIRSARIEDFEPLVHG